METPLSHGDASAFCCGPAHPWTATLPASCDTRIPFKLRDPTRLRLSARVCVSPDAREPGRDEQQRQGPEHTNEKRDTERSGPLPTVG
ncbi:MAG: hypothetical protein ACREXY_01315 [Gammaproteobacteria bacterium]